MGIFLNTELNDLKSIILKGRIILQLFTGTLPEIITGLMYKIFRMISDSK